MPLTIDQSTNNLNNRPLYNKYKNIQTKEDFINFINESETYVEKNPKFKKGRQQKYIKIAFLQKNNTISWLTTRGRNLTTAYNIYKNSNKDNYYNEFLKNNKFLNTQTKEPLFGFGFNKNKYKKY
jgi:hypothetical protein